MLHLLQISSYVYRSSKYFKKLWCSKSIRQYFFFDKKGEIVGFLGPNGAGKSPLMKILTTYINADEGKASVNGNDVNENQKSRTTFGRLFGRTQSFVFRFICTRIFGF